MSKPSNNSDKCYVHSYSRGDSPWQIENPMAEYLPVLAMQLAIVIFIIRLVIFVLKPLHQPRFVAKVMAIVLIGTLQGLRKATKIRMLIFPHKNSLLLATFSSLGLPYYMFLVGLEMDLSAFRHIGKKSLSIALVGTLIPFALGSGLFFLPIFARKERKTSDLGAIFWGITLTITSFPDLARILSYLKLLHTELGKIALTSAIVNDVTAWFLFAVAVITFEHKADLRKVPLATLPITFFSILCLLVLRPGVAWMIKRTKRRAGKFTDAHIYFVLIGVAVCGIVADACGTHAVIGGFLFGLIIPNGEFAFNIMEKTEEFVSGIMLPSYFVYIALGTDLHKFFTETNLSWVVLVIIVAAFAKILSTVLVCLYYGMPLRDGISLGGLMNTKGVMALVVLNKGRALQGIERIDVGVMVFAILVMTGLVGPTFFLCHKTVNRWRKYKQRTLQRSNPDTELRILTCTHSPGNVSSIINILEVSNATRKSPINVFAVHLAEITSRASAILIVHDILKTTNANSNNESPEQESHESDHIISAFRSYQDRNKDVLTVQPLTAASSFGTIHEEIFDIAEDKAVSMILVPFHKQPTADGELHGDNQSIREVNQRLLAKAPCSVGVLIDRGLGLKSSFNGLKFVMLFFGGPDDREALTYAWRMAGKPGIALTVIRFLQNKIEEFEVDVEDEKNDNEDRIAKDDTKGQGEKELDDDFINEFRFKSMYQQSITYDEKTTSNCDDIVDFIKSIGNDEFDLYIVGRGEIVKSPLTTGLSEWSDNYRELGPVGDILVSSNFIARTSVLVVQQFAPTGLTGDSHRVKTKFGQHKWASPILNPEYEALVNKEKKVY